MTRYLLVKSHVGFGDRLQCLSHAMTYAAKFNRTICIDWSDSAWSDGRFEARNQYANADRLFCHHVCTRLHLRRQVHFFFDGPIPARRRLLRYSGI